MRLFPVFAICLAACGGGDEEDTTFDDAGGALAIADCGYSITTRIGAEAPRVSGKIIGPDPTPRLVHLGIVGDARTSIVAQWRTMDETTTAGEIRYAAGANLTADQLTQKAKGIRFRYRSTGTTMYQQHQAHLCGLTAGTTYSYQVGAAGKYSPVYTFHTAPDVAAHPDAEVVLGFVGDSRGGYDVWAQLVDQLRQRMPDLMLFSGDAITIGLAQDDWDSFLTAAEPMFATTPVVATNGNHEDNAINYYSQIAMPGDQETFGFDYGFAHVTVANDTPEDPAALTTTVRDAIEKDFQASANARWKLLMHHQPMYSSGTRHGSNLTIQASWQPLVDQYHLDLVLNGHEHMYEISKPLIGQTVQPSIDTGTVYVVAGGAGAELYTAGTPGFWSDYIDDAHTAAVLHVRRDQLTLDSFHPDGTPVSVGYSKTKP